MIYLNNYKIFEKKSLIKFIKKDKKEGAKTDKYDVLKSGNLIGEIKWSSRLRGYSFLPTSDCEEDIKNFIKDLMSKKRDSKK